jgi:hypothetical protein
MRKKNKTSKIDARISERLRFGVELMARKLGISVSAYAARALEQALIADGIDRRPDAGMYSLLDRVFSQNEGERVLALCQHAPELASTEEKLVSDVLLAIKQSATQEELKELLDKAGVDLLIGEESADELIPLSEEMLASNPKLSSAFKKPGSFVDFLLQYLTK